jgi:hypothetical protein
MPTPTPMKALGRVQSMLKARLQAHMSALTNMCTGFCDCHSEAAARNSVNVLAEREGFEPSIRLYNV